MMIQFYKLNALCNTIKKEHNLMIPESSNFNKHVSEVFCPFLAIFLTDCEICFVDV